MAQHQHALVRYVTLDRCLSKFRLTKDELIDRCSDAVNRVSGDERRLSEKTFFNDIRALREGVVMGRMAPIRCSEGCYHYDEPGFSLFRAGKIGEDLKRLDQRLENMVTAAANAWALIRDLDLPEKIKGQIRELLHSDEAVLLTLEDEKRPRPRYSRKLVEQMTVEEVEAQNVRIRSYQAGLIDSLRASGDINEFLLSVLRGAFGDLPSFRSPVEKRSRWKRLLDRLGYRRFYASIKRNRT